QAEDGIRDFHVTGVQTCALPILIVALLLLAGCGANAGSGDKLSGMRIMVPNSPGGGYDITARTAAKVLEESGLARNVEVFNLPGAGGTVRSEERRVGKRGRCRAGRS